MVQPSLGDTAMIFGKFLGLVITDSNCRQVFDFVCLLLLCINISRLSHFFLISSEEREIAILNLLGLVVFPGPLVQVKVHLKKTVILVLSGLMTGLVGLSKSLPQTFPC